MPLRRYGDRKQQLCFPVEQKGVFARVAYVLMKETFVRIGRPSSHNDVSWTDSSSDIKTSPTVLHCGFVNAGLRFMKPFCFRTNRLCFSSETRSYAAVGPNSRVCCAVGSARLVQGRAKEPRAGQ